MANENSELKDQLLDAIEQEAVTPAVLVDWFSKSMTPAAKEALTAEDVQDVNRNLIDEKEYKELEGRVKDSLIKQKASLKSEFNKLLTQVNLKDPEEAQKMFPSDIRKQFDETFTKEWDKAVKEQEKASAEEDKKESAFRKFLAQYLLICGIPKEGNPDQKKMYAQRNEILERLGLEGKELRYAENIFEKGYDGILYNDEDSKHKKADIEQAGASVIVSILEGKDVNITKLARETENQGRALKNFDDQIAQNTARLAQPETFVKTLKIIIESNKANEPVKKTSDQSAEQDTEQN